MDKKTRQFIEIAIVSCLKGKKEAASIEIFLYLRKRRFRVASNLRQVAEICSAMKRRGVLLSRSRRTLLFGSRKRIMFWHINPLFYLDHPNESRYAKSMSLKEYDEGIKRRTKKRLKRRK